MDLRIVVLMAREEVCSRAADDAASCIMVRKRGLMSVKGAIPMMTIFFGSEPGAFRVICLSKALFGANRVT